jgi:hypothetical protein
MLQDTDLAEEENQEPKTGHIVTMVSGLSSCHFFECSLFIYIQNFWLVW